MRKILFILLLAPFALKSQTVNTFRDSTWFKRGVRFDSTLVFSKGAGVGKVWTSNANGTGSWQTFSSAGVTQGALDDSISAVRAIRKVDTIYKNLDSIVFKIKGVRYAVLDSTGGGVQTLSISGDTLSISGGNSVVLPVYVQVDSATVTSYDVLNSQNAPPVSPNVGDVYLVGNSPSGAWVGHAKDIAEWNGSAWIFTDGVQGDFLYNSTTALTYIFRSGNWVQTTGIPALNNGNTISSGLKIGTNNARSLKFETANLERGRIDSLGHYYIYDTSLRYSNKYVQIDSLTGRLIATEIPYNDGFIQLSGTVIGSPVTGDVEIGSYIKLYWTYGDIQQSVTNLDEYLNIESIDNISGKIGRIRIDPFVGINIFCSDTASHGLIGSQDFTANITDLDYPQKKYVDSHIADTATQLRSEIADTASSLHTLIDAKVSTTTLTDSLSTKTNKLIAFSSYTISDTLRLTDADKVIEMNVGSANNLVIPTNTAYAFPVGTQIVLIQIGAGQTTLVPASGVTVRSSSSKLKLTGQYSGATLIKKATNEWYLFGDITN